jgi:AcrR family transcriptional regulator
MATLQSEPDENVRLKGLYHQALVMYGWNRMISSGRGGAVIREQSSDAEANADAELVNRPATRVRKPRRPRRDAEANRERLLAAAVAAMLRDGPNVPLATIAADAGVGIGTLYRSYADREALVQALQFRAYGFLSKILDEIDDERLSGLDSVGEYLTRTLAISEQLILPLHGVPPLVTAEAVQARQAINQRLDRYIERGRAERSIRAPINGTDIIVFSALITQPLPHGPAWHRVAARQIAIFLNGVAGSGPIDLPGPEVKREDIEKAFALSSLQEPESALLRSPVAPRDHTDIRRTWRPTMEVPIDPRDPGRGRLSGSGPDEGPA